MGMRFEPAGLFLTLCLTTGCAPTVTPDAPPSSFDASCTNPPTFRMTVERGNLIPVISLTNGYLVVNGEERVMTPSTSAYWGPYTYQGTVPYDGEVRYRYYFHYISGTGNGSDQTVYGPDHYIVRPMGLLTWSASIPTPPVPDAAVVESRDRLPHRSVRMIDLFPNAGFSGTRSQPPVDLTIHNGYSIPISISAPRIDDRQTGAPIPGLTIANSSGSTSGYVITVPDGRDAVFRVSAQTNIVNGVSVFWHAGVKFPWTMGTSTCWFGPIWVEVSFTPHP